MFYTETGLEFTDLTLSIKDEVESYTKTFVLEGGNIDRDSKAGNYIWFTINDKNDNPYQLAYLKGLRIIELNKGFIKGTAEIYETIPLKTLVESFLSI